MKELIVFLGVYLYIGIILGTVVYVAISFQYFKARSILDRGNIVNIRGGPTFASTFDHKKMIVYFSLSKGLYLCVATIILWPIAIYVHFANQQRRQWGFVEEIPKES